MFVSFYKYMESDNRNIEQESNMIHIYVLIFVKQFHQTLLAAKLDRIDDIMEVCIKRFPSCSWFCRPYLIAAAKTFNQRTRKPSYLSLQYLVFVINSSCQKYSTSLSTKICFEHLWFSHWKGFGKKCFTPISRICK